MRITEDGFVWKTISAKAAELLFTLATSNLSDEEMRERYGIRIYDRMEEVFDRLYYKQASYRK